METTTENAVVLSAYLERDGVDAPDAPDPTLTVRLYFEVGEYSSLGFEIDIEEEGLQMIHHLFKILGIEMWGDAPGQYVRLQLGWDENITDYMVVGVGHIVKDIWYKEDRKTLEPPSETIRRQQRLS